jgi:sarcosine oxidase subunit beta
VNADAVVIGAGVIGSSVALELTRRGLEVVCVDKLPAAGYGSTSCSSAIIRFNYSTPSGVAMAWEGSHYWLDWPNHVASGEHDALAEFIEVPMLALKTEEDPQNQLVEDCRRFGVPYADLDLAELEGRFPLIDFRRFGPPAALDDHDAKFWGEPDAHHTGAIVSPTAGYISDPKLAAQNLETAASAEGATFRFKTEVTNILRSDNRVAGVELDDGSRIEAGIVVNVGGPHSSIINAMAGVESNISGRPLRREVFVVPAAAGTDYETEGVMIADIDTGIYFRPERGNNVLIGSAEPDCDVLEWIEDPDSCEQDLDEDEYQLLVLRASRRVRDLGVPLAKRGIASVYDATPDWTPVYDRSNVDGFYMACGSSGNQFKNAGVAGHVMAELITAVEAGHDHEKDPLVITGKYTGAAIDLRTFGRNRVITADSPSTVIG